MIQYPAIFHKISEMSVVYNVIFMILIFISNTEKIGYLYLELMKFEGNLLISCEIQATGSHSFLQFWTAKHI